MSIKTRWNLDFLAGLKRTKTNRLVLLYSSGIDSTACAILLKEQGYEIFPLFIYYGQSSGEVESRLVDKGVAQLGLKPIKKIDISNVTKLCSSKLTGDNAVTDKDAWLPARNTLFMILAGMYAQTIDADAISIGYSLDDNFVFGDNILVHHQLTEVLLTLSLNREIQVVLPIKARNKAQLVELIMAHKMLDLTVSCWNAKWHNGEIIICGQCANCLEREKALKKARIKNGIR